VSRAICGYCGWSLPGTALLGRGILRLWGITLCSVCRYAMRPAKWHHAAAGSSDVSSTVHAESSDSEEHMQRATEGRPAGTAVLKVQRGDSMGFEVSTTGLKTEVLRLPRRDKTRRWHRSRTRILAQDLKRGEPCGWCRRPCSAAWLMVMGSSCCLALDVACGHPMPCGPSCDAAPSLVAVSNRKCSRLQGEGLFASSRERMDKPAMASSPQALAEPLRGPEALCARAHGTRTVIFVLCHPENRGVAPGRRKTSQNRDFPKPEPVLGNGGFGPIRPLAWAPAAFRGPFGPFGGLNPQPPPSPPSSGAGGAWGRRR
jgi:hypothetical protein